MQFIILCHITSYCYFNIYIFGIKQTLLSKATYTKYIGQKRKKIYF